MGHLLIAYDLCVIMIGFSALSIAAFWAVKSKETYLRNFCILYACFTAILGVAVLRKYTFLNLQNFIGWYGYILAGFNLLLGFAIVVASIHFFHDLYQVKAGKTLTLAFVLIAILSVALTFSPIGATLHENEIHLGVGALISIGMYSLSFTYMLAIGYAFLGRVWKSNKRAFVIGMLVFATAGYIDGLIGFANNLQNPVVVLTTQGGFLLSSVPYALYGIFVIFYFLQFTLSSPAPQILPEALVSQYGITDREREIILKVIQGKSNAQIAGDLFISLPTVKTHLNNIYKKMDLNGRFDLISRIRSG